MKDLKHGFQNASTEQTIKPGTVVLFSCNTGYQLVGEKFITCSAYGQWSGSIPRCEEITCKAPPPIADGFWSNKGEYVTYSFGNIVTAFCDDTFNMDGAYTWNCSAQGWVTSGLKDTFPRCLKQDRSSNFSFVNLVLIGFLAFMLIVTNIHSHRKRIKKCFSGTKRNRPNDRRELTKQIKPLLPVSEEIDEAYGSKESKIEKLSTEETGRSTLPETETLLPKPSASDDIQDSSKRPSVQPVNPSSVQQQEADEQGAAYKLAVDSADIHSDDITFSYV